MSGVPPTPTLAKTTASDRTRYVKPQRMGCFEAGSRMDSQGPNRAQAGGLECEACPSWEVGENLNHKIFPWGKSKEERCHEDCSR